MPKAKQKMYTLNEIFKNKLLFRQIRRLGEIERVPYQTKASIRKLFIKVGLEPKFSKADNQMIYKISESQLAELNK